MGDTEIAGSTYECCRARAAPTSMFGGLVDDGEGALLLPRVLLDTRTTGCTTMGDIDTRCPVAAFWNSAGVLDSLMVSAGDWPALSCAKNIDMALGLRPCAAGSGCCGVFASLGLETPKIVFSGSNWDLLSSSIYDAVSSP
jgi:hypothetical protein